MPLKNCPDCGKPMIISGNGACSHCNNQHCIGNQIVLAAPDNKSLDLEAIEAKVIEIINWNEADSTKTTGLSVLLGDLLRRLRAQGASEPAKAPRILKVGNSHEMEGLGRLIHAQSPPSPPAGPAITPKEAGEMVDGLIKSAHHRSLNGGYHDSQAREDAARARLITALTQSREAPKGSASRSHGEPMVGENPIPPTNAAQPGKDGTK